MADFLLVPQLGAVADWIDAIPLPPPSLATPDAIWSQRFAIMPNNDPYDWDNDRLVKELCTGDRTWESTSSSGSLNLENFASKLREHEVDGACMLTDISEAELKEDLGLVKIGHRSYVRRAITELRAMSIKYSDYIQKHPASNLNATVNGLHYAVESLTKQVESFHGSVSNFTFGRLPNDKADDDQPSRKRPRLDPSLIDDTLVAQSLNNMDDPARGTDSNTLQMGDSDEEYHSLVNEKKRKRIAPTLVSTEIDPDRNRDIPTAADILHVNTISTPETHEPGMLFIDGVGRKRMVPVLQKSTIYLGKKALPVDGIFFVETPDVTFEPGNDAEDSTEFVHIRQEHLPGQERYVHHRVKHFLQSERIPFQRGNDKFIAIKPYQKKLLPKFRPASFALFSMDFGVGIVNRELLQDWPEVDDKAIEEPESAVDLAASGPGGQPVQLGNSYDDWDPEVDLQKYIGLEGDELLPLYGESDSDNEYDESTWREIEEEQGMLEKGPLRQSRRPPLDKVSINEAIEQGINHHIARWESKELPKLEKGAWKFWMKSRKRNSRDKQITALKMDVSHINGRLQKLKDEISHSLWSSKVQVVKQTTSLEGTVFDQQTLQWRISTLQSRVPPAKFEKMLEKMQNENNVVDWSQDLQARTDDELLESQDEQSSDEDGLDDFVFSDASGDEIDQDNELVEFSTQSDDDSILLGDESPVRSPQRKSVVEASVTPVKKPKLKLTDAATDYHSQGPATPIKDENRSTKRTSSNPNKPVVINLVSSSDEATPTKLTSLAGSIFRYTADGAIELNTPEEPKLSSKDLSVRQALYLREYGEIPPKSPLFDRITNIESSDEESPLAANRRRRRMSIDSAGTEEDESSPAELTSHRKKKKLVENVDAREMRERETARRCEQEERRAMLHASLSQLAPGDKEHDKIIVNDGASAPPYLHLNEHIAQRVKKHQIDGIRFLWHSVVRDDKEIQGCLLAHTMGLGKTMQTISLLVSIAEASKSQDLAMVECIPESLRLSKTLILCPPSLINNWMDELITWVKPSDLLGELRTVHGRMKDPVRLQTITAWHTEGGVLIMGYHVFRRYIVNKENKHGKRPYSEEEHERVLEKLLRGPNIVIADEAHEMKNAKSAVTKAAQQFETKCRIALTGSPLANNIMEYHTMIEWVSPNYLGPALEFRKKYAEPIEKGLYTDSSVFQKRRALKMLGVLERDIDPKVQRATMSVLKHDLKQKTEFTITIALTELQKQAYILYVRSMLGNASNTTLTKDGEFKQTTLWSWLALLTLLCNHPLPFREKLTERMEDAVRKHALLKTKELVDSDGTPDTEDSGIDVNAPVQGVSQALIDEETKLFGHAKDIKDIALSNKARILCQILDAAAIAKDKTLVFSQSIPTLDYLQELFTAQDRRFYRLDGSTDPNERQAQTKSFNNQQNSIDVFLISTKAGGLGLNLQSANRVVIFDFKFNPISEEQAIGRAYRIGQQKETFVYRFIAGGTFESNVHNKTIFKQQLASRVVDKKSPKSMALSKLAEFLFEPKQVDYEDLSEFEGVDKLVLDKVLGLQETDRTIYSIAQSDIFEKDDDEKLTVEEEAEVEQWHRQEKHRRTFGDTISTPSELRDYNPHRAALNAAIYTPGYLPAPPRYAISPSGAIVPPVQSTPLHAPRTNFPASTANLKLNRSQRGSSPLLGGGTSISDPPAHLTTPSEIRKISHIGSGIAFAAPTSDGYPSHRPIVLPPPHQNGIATSRSASVVQCKDKIPEKSSSQKTQDALDRQESASLKTTSISERGVTNPEKVPSPRVLLMAPFVNGASSRTPSEAEPSSSSRRSLTTMSNGTADLKKTDMFKATVRKPEVQSLRIPVVRKHKNKWRNIGEQDYSRSSSKSSAPVSQPQSRGMHSKQANNDARILKAGTNPPRVTSPSSNVANITGLLPEWAREKLNKQQAESASSRGVFKNPPSCK